MGLTIIAAMTRDRVIGLGGALPWNSPEDLHRFRKLTMGQPVIMGRKTFESIGRPLPGRTNIVVSSGSGPRGVAFIRTFDGALTRALQYSKSPCVIGGARIYAAALPVASIMHLTEIEGDYAGDTYFPEFDASEWELTSGQSFSGGVFRTYQRVPR